MAAAPTAARRSSSAAGRGPITETSYRSRSAFRPAAGIGWATTTRGFCGKSWLEVRHRVHELADGSGGLLQVLQLLVRELDLDDLLDSALAELHRHADEEAIDPELPVTQGGAGEDPLLVEHNRVDHLRDGSRWRIVGRAGLQQLDDLGAAIASTLDDL